MNHTEQTGETPRESESEMMIVSGKSSGRDRANTQISIKLGF